MNKDGTFTAKMQNTAGGVNGLIMRIVFRAVPEANWKELVERIARLEGYGGTVSNVSVSPPEDISHPFKDSYNYTRKDFPDWKNGRLAVGLPTLRLPDASDDKEKDNQPVILGFVVENHEHATIKLPAGYVPTLPAPVELNKPYAEYHATYKFANGALEVERDLITKKTEVAAADRADYRAFRKAVVDDEFRYIDLGNNENPTPQGSPEFQKAIRKAYTEGNQRHLQPALEAINQALKLNPNSVYAWEMAADIHMALRQKDQAIAAARKALDLAPDNFQAAHMLGSILLKAGKQDELVKLWRDFVQRNPDNAKGHSNLAEALQAEKKYSEAIQEIDAAIKLDPKDWYFSIMLGGMLVKSGDKAAAVTTFEKAVSQTSNPFAKNDASYDLADAGVNLPEDERWATQAVE
ncbi:MAG TPA: tetratricopeptide repeat protein, partial [Terriglobia bacterium]|nr:tetratricopeptide repeat protein [Terriglobia bacterium]